MEAFDSDEVISNHGSTRPVLVKRIRFTAFPPCLSPGFLQPDVAQKGAPQEADRLCEAESGNDETAVEYCATVTMPKKIPTEPKSVGRAAPLASLAMRHYRLRGNLLTPLPIL
jgi:hypothetical protein